MSRRSSSGYTLDWGCAEALGKVGGLLEWVSSAGALLGAAVWLVLLGLELGGRLDAGPIAVLFALGPLVAVPLCLELAAREGLAAPPGPFLAAARLLQPPAALLAAASLLRPWGIDGGLLAAPWLGVAGLVGLEGLRAVPRLLRRPSAGRAAAAAALLYLPVGAFGLLASAAGMNPLGFEEPLVLLVAVHFHFTAFAAPLLGAALARRLPAGGRPRRLLSLALAGAVVGPALVATGYVVGSAALRLAAVGLLAAALSGMALVQIATLRRAARGAPRALLALSSAALLAGMALAAVYALGDFEGRIWISIPAMATSHGVLNGIGFTLSGLLGRLLEARESS